MGQCGGVSRPSCVDDRKRMYRGTFVIPSGRHRAGHRPFCQNFSDSEGTRTAERFPCHLPDARRVLSVPIARYKKEKEKETNKQLIACI